MHSTPIQGPSPVEGLHNGSGATVLVKACLPLFKPAAGSRKALPSGAHRPNAALPVPDGKQGPAASGGSLPSPPSGARGGDLLMVVGNPKDTFPHSDSGPRASLLLVLPPHCPPPPWGPYTAGAFGSVRWPDP